MKVDIRFTRHEDNTLDCAIKLDGLVGREDLSTVMFKELSAYVRQVLKSVVRDHPDRYNQEIGARTTFGADLLEAIS